MVIKTQYKLVVLFSFLLLFCANHTSAAIKCKEKKPTLVTTVKSKVMHSGRTDQKGCHLDKEKNIRHCH